MVKNPPANAGDIRYVGSILGQEDSLEEGMATHCSILAWRIPWTEEPGYSLLGHKELGTTERLTLTCFLTPTSFSVTRKHFCPYSTELISSY